MPDVLDKNFSEAIDAALESGEKVVTVECPCCHKTYYVTESEAAFERVNRGEGDYQPNRESVSLRKLGRKCPYCGMSGMLGATDLFSFDRGEALYGEIAAEKAAEDAYERSRTPWSEVCGIGLDFDEGDVHGEDD